MCSVNWQRTVTEPPPIALTAHCGCRVFTPSANAQREGVLPNYIKWPNDYNPVAKNVAGDR